MKNEIESPSYMEMKLHEDGGETLVLRIPTFWDEPNKQWMGCIKTPKTKRLIHAEGEDSFSLQNNFNVAINNAFNESFEFCAEIYSMFEREE